MTNSSGCDTIQSERKEKEIKQMKQINLWRSTITGTVVEAPVDFIPQFDGWELIGTIVKE